MAGVVEELMPDEQSYPQRSASIASRWLNPDVFKIALAKKPTVGHTVEGYPTGQDQALHPETQCDVTADPEDSLFRHGLDAGGQVHVTLL
jgi:hypothetical protein